MLTKSSPEAAKRLFQEAQLDAEQRWQFYQYLVARDFKSKHPGVTAAPKPSATVAEHS